ncbi:unnamed protein product [Peronospora destructor]|uniref:Uncharacterized protein n=1 Tax=Peronospora destructor TaxID=86335 RepID=A0AAV0T6V0_9STRA|nr:unnamed protein product [Peronospora destructor]
MDEASTTESMPVVTLRKFSSLPAYDLALRRDDAVINSDSDTNSVRVASIAEEDTEEDVVSLSSASEISIRGTNEVNTASAASVRRP